MPSMSFWKCQCVVEVIKLFIHIYFQKILRMAHAGKEYSTDLFLGSGANYLMVIIFKIGMIIIQAEYAPKE